MDHALSIADWWLLFGHFLLLSLISIGGAIVVAPDMHRLMVQQQHLLTDAQFSASIALAQAAPGPNVLFVAVLGYQAAGLAGVAATMIGIMLPSTTLTFVATRWSHSRKDWLAIQAFKTGMAPITIALLASTGWILTAESANGHVAAFVAAVALIVWRTRVHLLWLIAAGALIGAAGGL